MLASSTSSSRSMEFILSRFAFSLMAGAEPGVEVCFRLKNVVAYTLPEFDRELS
jgi:hypothetical protein